MRVSMLEKTPGEHTRQVHPVRRGMVEDETTAAFVIERMKGRLLMTFKPPVVAEMAVAVVVVVG